MLVCVFPKHPKTLKWRAGSREVEGPKGPVNMPVPGDSEAFWLQPVMAILASVQPELGLTIYTGSNFPHPIQFRFSKEGLDHIVQNQPRSNLDGWWPRIIGPSF